MAIYVPAPLDFDATVAAWALTQSIGHSSDAIVPILPDWDGREMTDEDLALGIPAGGKGILPRRREDGTWESVSAQVVETFFAQDAYKRRLLKPFAHLTDTWLVHGEAMCVHLARRAAGEDPSALEALPLVGLPDVFHTAGDDDPRYRDYHRRIRAFTAILDATLWARARAVIADEEADQATWYGDVATLTNPGHPETVERLFARGARAVVLSFDNEHLRVFLPPKAPPALLAAPFRDAIAADHPGYWEIAHSGRYAQYGEWNAPFDRRRHTRLSLPRLAQAVTESLGAMAGRGEEKIAP